ncbi:HNH endonuclease signature motif containing protein [Pseudomonas sp. R76]|uniref:HNH endonuclease signature motif containing protein n=1 Tax=Pseudomonas sp. R76 TaxID=1573711 RepID=UPI00131FF1D9|nr:HNH endonuclease signature motif containing protein [Pseudomonas sp. R76]QHD04929.1 hypothetical protein PspR76_03865 [Pseudomonas sp. R76]
MASAQRKIKPALKRILIEKAGGKCANPGCSNWRVHIHHIKHWAIYKAHTADDMIAVCPSCHDAAHYGHLQITDEMLYQWKDIVRASLPNSIHLYVEPGVELKLLTGSISFTTTNDQAALFELSNSNHLKIRVLDRDLLLVSIRLQDQSGKELLRVIENHVRVAKNESIIFDYRAGRVRVTVPATEDFVPRWLIQQIQARNPDFAANNRIVALDIEVVKPGIVRVQGCWPDKDVAVVITQDELSFCSRERPKPLTLVGEGEGSVIVYAGPITSALFGFAGVPAAG